MPPTVRQPLARPESAVGRCWSAARRPAASRIHCEPNGLIAFLGVSGFFGAGKGRRRRFSGAKGAKYVFRHICGPIEREVATLGTRTGFDGQLEPFLGRFWAGRGADTTSAYHHFTAIFRRQGPHARAAQYFCNPGCTRGAILHGARIHPPRECCSVHTGPDHLPPDLVRASLGSPQGCSRLPNRGFRVFECSRPYAGVRASRLAMNINLARNLTRPSYACAR
jgi:hypothetical protein